MDVGSLLAQRLCAEAERPPPDAARAQAIEAALQKGLSAGREQYGGVKLEAEAFVQHLAPRLPQGDVVAALGALHLDDLYLACACSRGDAAALAELDRRHLSQVTRAVASFGRSPDFADDVQQELRRSLLVGAPGKGGRILEYSGAGALSGWIRIAAVRIAIGLQRSEKPASPDELLETLLPGPDPELDFVKLRDREAVRDALLESIRALDPRDLGLLRLHYAEHVSLEKLAAVHRVHRATMARWLAAARAFVLDRSRTLLRERLKLSPDECDSLIQLVRSRLEASLARALAPEPK